MMIPALEDSQRTAAKVAGFAYLMTFAIVVYVNFGIHAHLIVASDAAETAKNILSHERLFRIGIAGDLIYCVGLIVLLTALYVVLEPVNRGLALLAAFLRLVWTLMWLEVTLNLFNAMRLLRSTEHLTALEAEPLLAVARVYLGSSSDYYYVGLLFGALASTACAYLWFKSRYVPRTLAAFGIAASAFGVTCTLIFYIFPGFSDIVGLSWFDIPTVLFDMALSLWLIVRGLKSPGRVGLD